MRALHSAAIIKIIVIAMMILSNSGLLGSSDIEGFQSKVPYYSPLSASAVSIEIEQTSNGITLNLAVEELDLTIIESKSQWRISGEGVIGQDGMPDLPAICRYLAVPDAGRLSVTFSVENSIVITAPQPTNYTIDAAVDDIPVSAQLTVHTGYENALYPADAVHMSEPMIMRGVRMVALTFFPLQWDATNAQYVKNLNFKVDINAHPARGKNEVHSLNRQPSKGFDTLIDKLLVNPPVRDQGHQEYLPGGYLVVADENAPDALQEFIDWKRHVGHRVDLLSIDGESIEIGELRNMIIDVYDDVGFEFLVFMGTDDADPPLHIPMDREFYDIYYAQLEGDDILPEVAVGTFNCITEENFICAIRRSISYQYTPFMENTEWFTRAGVGVGACSVPNDLSPSYTGKWITEVLSRTNFDDIAASYYSDNEINDPSPMIEEMYNDQANFLLVRAHMWDLDVEQIEVGPVYPFQFLCSSGTISPPDNGAFNWIFRQGTPDAMKGASAGFGHQSSPRTNVANALAGGLAESMFTFDIGSYGWARNYTVANLARVMVADGLNIMPYYYSHWRYYGDPGQGCWVGVPSEVQELDADEQISPDATSLSVHVELPDGDDLSDVLITFTQGAELMKFARPDDEGNAVFTWGTEVLTDDTVYLTVTGNNLVPALTEIEVIYNPVYIALDNYDWTDVEEGNYSEVLNPGDRGSITAEFGAVWRDDFETVDLTLGMVSSWIEINEFQPIHVRNFEDEGLEIQSLIATVLNGCPDGTEIRLEFNIQHESPDGEYTAGMTFNVEAPRLVIIDTEGDLDAGEQTDLFILIRNRGSLDSQPLVARLESLVPFAVVVENDSEFEAVNLRGEAERNNNPFVIAVDENTIPGSVAWFRLILEGGGVLDSLYFALTVGEPEETDPLGPDSYGYIALSHDDDDVEWANAPVYNWIEICPWLDAVFEGNQIMEAIGDEEDFSEVLDIPFPFRYYGEEFDQITVCSNGWIAVGDQSELKNQQNWLLPGFNGAYGMMAVFWDRLHFNGDDDGICYYHDGLEGRFIIEWVGNVEQEGDSMQNAFQIILYDANRYETPTGDSQIIYQYHTVNNLQEQWEANAGASVGISSPIGLDGLTYTYWHEYPASCTPLEAETAILWTTITFAPLASISGRVDRWVDSTAVAGATVQTSHGFQTTTSGDGSYRIVGFEPGQFDLTVSADRYGEIVIEGLEVEQGEAIEQDVILPHMWLNTAPDTIEYYLGVGGGGGDSFVLAGIGEGVCNFTLSFNFEDSELNPEFMEFGFSPDDTTISAGENLTIDLVVEGKGNNRGGFYYFDVQIDTDNPQVTILIPVKMDLILNVDEEILIPDIYALTMPYPNPFNSSVIVSFSLPVVSQTSIVLYDLSGKQVRTLASGHFSAGNHTITMQGDELSTGIYFLRMEAGEFVRTRRLLLLR